MAGFVWKRAHTIAAASTAVVLVGVGTAVAIGRGPDAGTASPPAVAPRASGTPSAAVKPSAAPSTPRPDPVDPLTGRKPTDHKVIAVKVENIAAARPQVGLNSADIVFAEEVEGSLTRLIAVYHTAFPKRVGPVRSARNTDVGLLPVFGEPGLVYSGANRKVQANIEDSSIVPLQRSDRDSSRVAPHNVFVNLSSVANKAKKVGDAQNIGWTFAADNPRWDAAAKDATVTGRVGGDTFSFKVSDDHYVVRWNGKAYADGNSGKNATTDNVMIMSVKNRADGNADVNGARSVKSITTGTGDVVIYRDGRKLSGTWRRSGPTKPMHLVDREGKHIPLKPGRTWVLLCG
jgi:hypothetical protein